MRYAPGLFGHLPEWETPESQTRHRSGDRVDLRPTRVPSSTRRRRRSL